MALKEEYESIGQFCFRFRSYIPLILLPLFFGYILLHQSELAVLNSYTLMRWCLVVGFTGILIRCIAIGYSAPNTSGRNVSSQIADSMNTTGIYSLVRHPLYLGNLLIWIGLSLLLGSYLVTPFIILFFWLYYEKIMYTEEEYLRRKFGANFEEWAKITPLLLPNFKHWKPCEHDYNLKKVIRKENDGIYAFVLLTFVMKISIILIAEKSLSHVPQWWYTVLIIATFLYGIIKYIKKKTMILR